MGSDAHQHRGAGPAPQMVRTAERAPLCPAAAAGEDGRAGMQASRAGRVCGHGRPGRVCGRGRPGNAWGCRTKHSVREPTICDRSMCRGSSGQSAAAAGGRSRAWRIFRPSAAQTSELAAKALRAELFRSDSIPGAHAAPIASRRDAAVQPRPAAVAGHASQVRQRSRARRHASPLRRPAMPTTAGCCRHRGVWRRRRPPDMLRS
jgi:hypothetical protein